MPAAALRPLTILKKSFSKFYHDEGPFLARGLAFGLMIYCIPLSLLSVSALSYTVVSSDVALWWLNGIVEAFMPQFRDEFTSYLTSIVNNRGLLGVAGFISFLLASSTTFGSLRIVLNKVFQVPESRGIIRGKAMEVVMMFWTSSIFFVMIALVYMFNLVQSIFVSLPLTKRLLLGLQTEFPSLPDFVHPGMLALGAFASFSATVALFWFLYRVSPARALGSMSLLVGAITAAVLFELSKVAFAWYLQSAEGETALFGTLGGLIFFFLWLYYSCAVFVFGAEVAWTLEERSCGERFN